MKNHSSITTFILLGLTDNPRQEVLLSVFLFLTYMSTITGNLVIILLTLVSSYLKTPMYFFLRNFSILEIIFTTVCVPRFLCSMTTGDKRVTYNAGVIVIGATEFSLLTAMSYDHYVAICKPLHYTTIMSEKFCTILVLCSWLIGLIVMVPPLSLGVQLDFCNSNLIDHFDCDASPLLKIMCSDTQFIEQLVLIMAVLTLILTLVCVIVSYTYIIKTILRLSLAQQRKKAFSTCSFHMIVVSIADGNYIFIYIKPAKEGVAINKVVSLLNTSIIPLMNTFIYTLWNKQAKQAFRDSIKKLTFISRNEYRFLESIQSLTILIPEPQKHSSKNMRWNFFLFIPLVLQLFGGKIIYLRITS
ncbi:olfactory receptor 6C2-like [Cervus canadensis]|uniref:olfactory receptor 6C2-like n=1 Tax=Cervus canadensis TaxID=1574408 RepID=UPI001CA37A47|nr:olfactory receptor 6C2-like [Cervus canadensis]